MEWNVYIHDVNRDKMKIYNIFEHRTFKENVEKWLKESETKGDFADHLQRELRYYFWSKAEWEIIISPWVGSRNNPEEKIDVYDQVMINWEAFLDYVWSYEIYEIVDTTENDANEEDNVLDDGFVEASKCCNASYCNYSMDNKHCHGNTQVQEECPYLNAIGEIARLSAELTFARDDREE